MKEPVFKGSCTAIITPFSNDGIDLERLKNQLHRQAAGGTKAIVVAGTTGENATLEIHEYERLVDFSIRCVEGAMKVIVGIGGNNTEKCLEKARFAQNVGADAVLMTPPYYNKTTQEGVKRHFFHVADSIDLPLILYNVPSRTAIGIASETYKALSEHPNVNGVKEASGDFSLIARVAAECAGKLFLWSGNDDNTIPMMSLGALGVVSVASNLVPEVLSRLCALCLDGQFSGAALLYAKYAELMRLLFVETNPIPVKAAMEMMGLDSGLLRLPLISMSERSRAALRECLKKLSLIS